MNNAQIAEVFHRIAALTELKGDSVFAARAYRHTAYTIERLPVELEMYVREGKDLKKIEGIGEAIARKIQELLDTGRLEFYEKLQAEFPPGLPQIMDIPGVGAKTALRLWCELGVTTVEELERAIEDGRVEKLPRLGKKMADNILRHWRTPGIKGHRTSMGRALHPQGTGRL